MMRISKVFILFFYTILLYSLTYANTLTTNEILDKIENKEKTIKGVQFNFEQEIIYTLTNEKQINSGNLIFLKPQNIKIKQFNPIEQQIVTNGKKIWVYTPDYNQVIIDSWKNWAEKSSIPSSLLNFGKNWKDLKEKYEFKYIGIKDSDYLLKLSPLKDNLWELEIWVDSKDFIINKASLIGENIIINTYAKDYKINPAIDKNIFKYDFPKSVDVLELE